MMYNWQYKDWPNFSFENNEFDESLVHFGKLLGKINGVELVQLGASSIDAIVDEAVKTSLIEGEKLLDEDVKSSIRKNLGIHEQQDKIVRDERAKGIAKLMLSVRKDFDKPLSQKMLFDWHIQLMQGNQYIKKGKWRNHTEPMQIVSGTFGKEKVHFEAPPSSKVAGEMKQFITWFNETSKNGKAPIFNPFIRAGLAHLYFESIHPFEDGNGRIGRVLIEKAMFQAYDEPLILSLSSAIEQTRKEYYNNLKQSQTSLNAMPWLTYFEKVMFLGQEISLKLVLHTLNKSRYYKEFSSHLNARQQKVMNKLYSAGYDGFEQGLTAKKYMKITKTSKATATRDLQDLTLKKLLIINGAGRSVYYVLNKEPLMF